MRDSTYARHRLKGRILKHKLIPYVCAICGIGPIWNGKPMPLILDHINGVNNDNRLENLRFTCSNCGTQLPTYCSKNYKLP
ncbi:HNH endonuclease [Gordonia phage Sixama]|uniref:HNH endonuclease n=1 Tax=Gordonia phage Sixama TaxID=2653271 RepID=A0A5Q2F0N4_9CAUD|nr:HNH endonuclease [Gordonia phage Sixama]QGF20312.1 HNH endonuclease [Gordonia phage Sixama]